ncbi:MAG: hypothetical protein Solivirus1_73 [Solivirus sp.]|uniref:Thioredoxin domain-containing protein n=1 Tax=Solivirus sp. TaxID=2487772 RepID=A0A3G5AFC4_9VIRU|nr:MAG: hypothetical protein Solivirus1_73 [Solivirus sp.]
MSNLPVIILISSESCGWCKKFAPEWEKLKAKLNGRARFVSFRVRPGESLPSALSDFVSDGKGWLPMIIMTSAAEYGKYFTSDDRVISSIGKMRANRYNAIEEEGKIKPANNPNTADAIALWFRQSSR